MSLRKLPGELHLETRDALPLCDIKSHLAFYDATFGIMSVYDERFWRRLCFAHGIGRPFPYFSSARKMSWREIAQLIENYWSSDSHICDVVECKTACQFAQANSISLPSVPSPLLLNPIFSRIRLDWMSLDPTSNAHIFEPVNTQQKLTGLSDHLGLYSFATSPPVPTLRIQIPDMQIPDQHDDPLDLLTISRPDGEALLVQDVIIGIHRWMETPLTELQQQSIIATSVMNDPEGFRRLSESTDEDTLAWYWGARLSCRRNLVSGRFAGLQTGTENDSPVTLCIGEGDSGNYPTQNVAVEGSWLHQRINHDPDV